MEFFGDLYKSLNAAIEKASADLNKEPQELYEPQRYILGLGGKRLRPLLTLIACDLFNRDAQDAIDAAIAVELFHNFSLIHDDIMDNAPLRRGSVTVHEKWNQNIAILSGDAMLVSVYRYLAKYDGDKLQQMMSVFNQTALEVCEGQQMDMNYESTANVSIEAYIEMIGLKTAVLLGCSLQLGAIAAGANDADQKNLYEFGKHLGIAFQLKDDELDVFGDEEKVGKQSGGDIIANKKTFLLLKSLELANPDQKRILNEWIAKKQFDPKEKVNVIKDIYIQLNIKTLCEEEVSKHYKAAVGCLDSISCDPQKRTQLLQLAQSLMFRQH